MIRYIHCPACKERLNLPEGGRPDRDMRIKCPFCKEAFPMDVCTVHTVARKQPTTARWLCICFGWAGVHRFYLGEPGVGVLYACTLGLVGVGWVRDIMTISAQVRAANQHLRQRKIVM